MYILR